MVSGVVRGVDTHADVHVAAALDTNGGLLGIESFPTNTAGYRSLADWLTAFGPVVSNDRCPCGSGFKYKRCHGSRSATECEMRMFPEILAWARDILTVRGGAVRRLSGDGNNYWPKAMSARASAIPGASPP